MSPTPRHDAGTLLAERYEVVETLFGGMGEIIVCRDRTKAGRPLVALKTFAAGVLETPVARDAIGIEADAWLRLGMAPGGLVLQLLRVEQIGYQPYLVMPYCSKGNLRQAGRLSAPVAMRYLTQVLLGLHELEVAGLAHRDLKPENILITDEDCAVVSDLGLARLVREQEVAFLIGEASREDKTSAAGTLPYMAPEQLLGRKDMDGRVDLWAFGVLCVELLAGRWPFNGPDAPSIAKAIFRESPQGIADANERVPAIGPVLSRLLAKNPDHRFRSFANLSLAWDQLIRMEGSEARGGFLRRDRRVTIDDPWLAGMWHLHFFPKRLASHLDAIGQELVRVKATAVNTLQQAENYARLEQHQKVLELLLPLLGSPADPASLLGGLLLGSLQAGQIGARSNSGSAKLDLMLGRDGVVSAAALVLRSYVAILEPGGAVEHVQAEALSFARVFQEHPDVGRSLTGHAAQVLTLVGKHSAARELLFSLVESDPADSSAWNTLFLATYLEFGEEQARSVAEAATELLKDGPYAAQYVCGHMWGVLKEWGRSAEHARAALTSKPSDPGCLFMLVAALYNSGRRAEALPSFRTLLKVAPDWEKTKRLAPLFA